MSDLLKVGIFICIVVIYLLLVTIYLFWGNGGKKDKLANLVILITLGNSITDLLWIFINDTLSGYIIITANSCFGIVLYALSSFFLFKEIDFLKRKVNLFLLPCLVSGIFILLNLMTPFTGTVYEIDSHGTIIADHLYSVIAYWNIIMVIFPFFAALVIMVKGKNRNADRFKRAKLVSNTVVIFFLFSIIEVLFLTVETSSASLPISMALIYLYLRKNDTYIKESKEKAAKIEAELNAAKKIQIGLLPSTFPAFPNRKEFNIYATLHPSKEVGGDFYDFYMPDKDHLVMTMADVSGNGMPAALFMAAAKSIIKQSYHPDLTAGEMLSIANDEICKDNREKVFVTVWLAILDLNTGKVDCANAGHEYPVLRLNEKPYSVFKDSHGFVLGVIPGQKYQSYSLQLSPGDVIFMYTDGIPEAENKNGEFFGMDKMLSVLNENTNASNQECLSNLFNSVNTFSSEMPQSDDITMLYLEYKGAAINANI